MVVRRTTQFTARNGNNKNVNVKSENKKKRKTTTTKKKKKKMKVKRKKKKKDEGPPLPSSPCPPPPPTQRRKKTTKQSKTRPARTLSAIDAEIQRLEVAVESELSNAYSRWKSSLTVQQKHSIKDILKRRRRRCVWTCNQM